MRAKPPSFVGSTVKTPRVRKQYFRWLQATIRPTDHFRRAEISTYCCLWIRLKVDCANLIDGRLKAESDGGRGFAIAGGRCRAVFRRRFAHIQPNQSRFKRNLLQLRLQLRLFPLLGPEVTPRQPKSKSEVLAGPFFELKHTFQDILNKYGPRSEGETPIHVDLSRWKRLPYSVGTVFRL